MRDYFLFFTSRNKSDQQKSLLTVNDNICYDQATTAAGDYNNPTAAMALILKSWLNGNRFRYLILILCSPIIIPIVCAIFPFICAAEVCFRICRRRRLKSEPAAEVVAAAPPQRRKEDVNNKEMSLLDRYLDDQLELAIEILDECGGELGLGFGCDFLDDDYFDCNYQFNNNNNNKSSSNSLC
uniref:uncharacterized protein LOC122585621 n=1 Tax=Erigeron canadensis TaxID=72917 RepID=UPI001CB96541|nr:uncharacterized protein LOC122585621 [Erigeron canadensis]